MPFWLSILLFSILISLLELQLLEGFYRVPSCPTPNNLTAWKEASDAINCTNDLENTDLKNLNNIYHCMPSNYLNETVAFCGPMKAITEGNCPVLNYERQATVPTGRRCSMSNFTNGCPKKLFHTREIYKYPACLKINTLEKCYLADPGCPRNVIRSITPVIYTTTTGLGTTTTINPDDKNISTVYVIVIAVFGSVIIFLLIIIIAVICFRRRKICRQQITKTKNPAEREENIEMLSKQKNSSNDVEDAPLMNGYTQYEENEKGTIENATMSSDEESKGQYGLNQYHREVTAYVENEKREVIEKEELNENFVEEKQSEIGAKELITTHRSEDVQSKEYGNSLLGIKEKNEKIAEKKETGNEVLKTIIVHRSEVIKSRNAGACNSLPVAETSVWDENKRNRLLFNDFYSDLVEKMIERDLVPKISLLLQDKNEENTINQRGKFIEWNKEHDFQYNIWHLQQLLKKCRADDLVEACAEFGKRFPLCLAYFKCPVEGTNHESITLYTHLDISEESVQLKMKEIRDILASLFHLEPREIKLHGIKEGSLILTYALPKENVIGITKINLSSLWSLSVYRIETANWIIEPGFMRSKCMLIMYVQITPRHSRIKDLVQLFVLAINSELTAMGLHIKIYGHKIKCQIIKNSSAKGCKSIENTSPPFEKDILDNMEPSIVKKFLQTRLTRYHSEIEDIFSPTKSRKQTAKDILLFLSGKKRKVFKNTMNCVIDMYRNKEIPTCEKGDEKDSTMTEENGLFENTEMLLDEIDSSIIDDTFEEIGDVPFDIVEKCSPRSGRKRKERAKTFYDFVNRNKDHFQIFKSILQSNAD